MRNLFFIIGLTACILSCEKDPVITDVIGKWKYEQFWADPGNGGGAFVTVNSQKTIEFFTNGTVISNGAICDGSIESDLGSTGTFTIDNVIYSAGCDQTTFGVRFEIVNNKLELRYPCFESCIARFGKID